MEQAAEAGTTLEKEEWVAGTANGALPQLSLQVSSQTLTQQQAVTKPARTNRRKVHKRAVSTGRKEDVHFIPPAPRQLSRVVSVSKRSSALSAKDWGMGDLSSFEPDEQEEPDDLSEILRSPSVDQPSSSEKDATSPRRRFGAHVAAEFSMNGISKRRSSFLPYVPDAETSDEGEIWIGREPTRRKHREGTFVGGARDSEKARGEHRSETDSPVEDSEADSDFPNRPERSSSAPLGHDLTLSRGLTDSDREISLPVSEKTMSARQDKASVYQPPPGHLSDMSHVSPQKPSSRVNRKGLNDSIYAPIKFSVRKNEVPSRPATVAPPSSSTGAPLQRQDSFREELDGLNLLEREKVVMRARNVSLLCKTDSAWPTIRGTLYATNYQLIMRNARTEVLIPIMNIMKATKKSLASGLDQIKLYMHDMRAIKLTFDKVSTITATFAQPDKKKMRAKRGSMSLVHNGDIMWQRQAPFESDDASSVRLVNKQMKKGDLFYDFICKYRTIIAAEQLFAFAHRITLPKALQFSTMDGWRIYSPIEDFNRMWLPNDQWIISDLNKDYKLCATYPRTLCLVKDMTESEIIMVSKYRSKGRLPALSWIHPSTGAALTRSSQPLVGMGKRLAEDEKLLHVIRKSNGKSRHLHIIDARPKANAAANKTMGGGYELTQAYSNCHIYFMGIENIHKMRESRNALFNMLKESRSFEEHGWYSSLDDTQWLRHIYLLLKSSHKIVRLLERGESVLTHCSDGWDRTPQITSLAQLMLDPYYRTLKGFAVLIEKEWLSFGHKFGERCGHGLGKAGASEVSPIFLQFLDACWQLTSMYPLSFEFSDSLLVLLADEVYNCRFGTFLFNNEQERLREHEVHKRTVSIWTYIFLNPEDYTNPFYRENHTVLHPKMGISKLRLWESYFLRWEQSHARESKDEVIASLRLELMRAKELIQQMQQNQETVQPSTATPTNSENEKAAESKASNTEPEVTVPQANENPLPPASTTAADEPDARSPTVRRLFAALNEDSKRRSPRDSLMIGKRILSKSYIETDLDFGSAENSPMGSFQDPMRLSERALREPHSSHEATLPHENTSPDKGKEKEIVHTDKQNKTDEPESARMASSDTRKFQTVTDFRSVNEAAEDQRTTTVSRPRQQSVVQDAATISTGTMMPFHSTTPGSNRREKKKEHTALYLFIADIVEEMIEDAARVGSENIRAQNFSVGESEKNAEGATEESDTTSPKMPLLRQLKRMTRLPKKKANTGQRSGLSASKQAGSPTSPERDSGHTEKQSPQVMSQSLSDIHRRRVRRSLSMNAVDRLAFSSHTDYREDAEPPVFNLPKHGNTIASRRDKRKEKNRISLSFTDVSSLRQTCRIEPDEDIRFSAHWEALGAEEPSTRKFTPAKDPPTWIPDSWARVCLRCKRGFNPVHRKHHCRHCGNIFCNKCTSKRIVLPFVQPGPGKKGPVRVCDPCYIKISRYSPAADGATSTDTSAPLSRRRGDSFHQLTYDTTPAETPFTSVPNTPATLSPLMSRVILESADSPPKSPPSEAD